MSTAIHSLRAEHARILRATELTFELARRLENGQPVPVADIEALMQFLAFFAHRTHRDKEEEWLFPALSDKGFYEGPGCIGVLLHEHEDAAQAFQRMVDGAEAYRDGNAAAGRLWARAAQQYADALRQHVRREEDVLFTNAERLLTEADQQALAKEFARIDERARRAGLDEVEAEFERATALLGRGAQAIPQHGVDSSVEKPGTGSR